MHWKALNNQRLKLGMSLAALARLSKVSLPTVQRILSGQAPHADLANVLAISEALGARLEIRLTPARQVRKQHAVNKARRLVGMVQGTSALEGQAVASGVVDKMVARTARELLKSGGQSLWGE